MPVQYLELINVSPDGSERVVTSAPNITLTWSNSIKTEQFSTESLLQSFVILNNLSTGARIGLSYVGYDPDTRTVTLTAGSLESGQNYQILVKKGIRDIHGRAHPIDRTWEFTMASTGLTAPLIITPVDKGVTSVAPNFSWSNLGTNYHILIDNNPSFNSPLVDEVINDDNYNPSVVYEFDTTYFWKVRAITGSASGDWSDTKSFYLSSTPTAHPTTSNTPQIFYLQSSGINGLYEPNTNLLAWPNISFNFSDDLADLVDLNALIHKVSVLPRNDLDATPQAVSGEWGVTGSTLSFTPLEDIETNTRYVLSFTPKNTSGKTLEKYQTFFTGKYTPYYTDLMSVKALLGREAAMHSDDLLNWIIHRSSLEANAIYLATLGTTTPLVGVEGITETEIRIPQLKSHIVMRWVTAAAAVAILKKALNDELRNVGRSRKLADYSESLDADFIKAIQEAIKNAEEELDKWTSELIGPNNVYGVSAHSDWSRTNWFFDSYIGPLTWGTNF